MKITIEVPDPKFKVGDAIRVQTAVALNAAGVVRRRKIDAISISDIGDVSFPAWVYMIHIPDQGLAWVKEGWIRLAQEDTQS